MLYLIRYTVDVHSDCEDYNSEDIFQKPLPRFRFHPVYSNDIKTNFAAKYNAGYLHLQHNH